MRTTLVVLLFFLVFVSCKTEPDANQIEQWKEEIRQTELSFSAYSDSLGTKAAFLAFAAPDAVLKRRGEMILGIEAIGRSFDSANPEDKLTWAPDFVDVASSGDLGYTWGKFVLQYKDSLGNEQQSNGYFHTVWKRQEDGSWKFVYD